MTAIPINPPAAELGRGNALLIGRGRQYETRFAGPLSLKSVVRGAACWETAAGRFVVEPRSVLLLNDGEEYTIEVEALHPVETFCVFFGRGFVEDAVRSAIHGSASLLDRAEVAPVAFAERLHYDASLLGSLDAVRRDGSEESLCSLASALVRLQVDVDARVGRLPALRATTRAEIRRRLDRAVESIHANLGKKLRLEDIASAACLSPFHFHRLFSSYYGATPHRYITRMRLERARSLLRGTRRSVADVAFDCGFESVGSFTTLFGRTFGVSPARLRKMA